MTYPSQVTATEGLGWIASSIHKWGLSGVEGGRARIEKSAYTFQLSQSTNWNEVHPDMPITNDDLDRVAELLTVSEDETENKSRLFALWAEQGELASVLNVAKLSAEDSARLAEIVCTIILDRMTCDMANDTAEGESTSTQFLSHVFRTYVSQRCGLVQAYASPDMDSGQYEDRQMALHQAWIGLPGSVHAAFGQASRKTDAVSQGRFAEVLYLHGRRSAIESLGPRSSGSGGPTILFDSQCLVDEEGKEAFARWTEMCDNDRRARETNIHAGQGYGSSQHGSSGEGAGEGTARFA